MEFECYSGALAFKLSPNYICFIAARYGHTAGCTPPAGQSREEHPGVSTAQDSFPTRKRDKRVVRFLPHEAASMQTWLPVSLLREAWCPALRRQACCFSSSLLTWSCGEWERATPTVRR